DLCRARCRHVPSVFRGLARRCPRDRIYRADRCPRPFPDAGHPHRGPVSARCIRQYPQHALCRGDALMPGVRWMLGLVLCVMGAQALALPGYEAVRAAHRPSDVRVLAADGELAQRVRVDFSSRRGDWIPLSDISVALQQAVLHSEDGRVHTHSGVDWRALARAAWHTLSGGHVQGASTISMQLAALLDETLQRAPGGRRVAQKFDQIRAAQTLESIWTKHQILEAYLNQAAFR